MLLIEIFQDESEDEFRHALEASLAAQTDPPTRWWTPFELRRFYECRGIAFREIFGVGSVLGHFIVTAMSGGERRVIGVPDRSTWVASLEMIGDGQEVPLIMQEIIECEPP